MNVLVHSPSGIQQMYPLIQRSGQIGMLIRNMIEVCASYIPVSLPYGIGRCRYGVTAAGECRV
jgi:hypothetical protein